MAYKILEPLKCRRVKGVLFDMDGVVLDTEKLYTRFWAEASAAYGYNMTYEQALGMRSLNRTKGQNYLESLFGKNIDYKKIRLERIKRMDTWIEKYGVEPKEGINEILLYLRDMNIPCAITTSSPPDRIKSHLEPLGLYDKFDAICSGYQVKNGKPEPDIYLYGAESIKREPRDCLAAEDSPAGIESAFRAGAMSVIIPDKDEPSERTLSMSVIKADRLTDLIDIINLLNT